MEVQANPVQATNLQNETTNDIEVNDNVMLDNMDMDASNVNDDFAAILPRDRSMTRNSSPFNFEWISNMRERWLWHRHLVWTKWLLHWRGLCWKGMRKTEQQQQTMQTTMVMTIMWWRSSGTRLRSTKTIPQRMWTICFYKRQLPNEGRS